MKNRKTLHQILQTSISLFVIVLLLNSRAFAEDSEMKKGSLSGTITENLTGTALQYAQVAIYSTNDSALVNGTITNETGHFEITKIPFGQYYMIVEFIGYEKHTQDNIQLSIETSAVELAPIGLNEKTSNLDEVNVLGQKRTTVIKADKKVLNVAKNLSASGGTAIDALKVSPSVTVNQDGDVLLRGSSNFKVLVDGKPTALKPNEALKQMPAGRIDNIEIITNPSVKYDAEGTAGIINIITKKGMGVGTSGQINATAGTGEKYNADLNLNYTNNKVNVTLGAKWKDQKEFYNMDELMETMKEGKKRSNDIDFYRLQTTKDIGINTTIDYKFNDKNELSYSADLGSADLYIDANFKYDETTEGQTGHNYVYEDLHTFLLADYLTNNLTHTFNINDNSSWTNSLFFSRINYLFCTDQARFTTLQDFNLSGVKPYYHLRFENENFSTEFKAKTDYSLKGKDGGMFETGAQYHRYNRYLDLQAEHYNFDTELWQSDQVFTNEFDFNEQIYSAYANYSSEYKGFSYTAGLRLEYTNRIIESFTINQKYQYARLNPFVNVSVSKAIGEGQQLVFNYSNRIDRPDEYFLNPFPDVSNEFQEAYGNPLLRPNITDSYELGFQKHFAKGMFSTQAFFRNTNDAYTQVIGSNNDGVMILTFDNISDDKEYGLENMVNLQATSWWSLNASLNVFGQNSKGMMNNEAFNRSAITFDTRLINSFTLGKNASAQLMAFYFHDRIGNSIGTVSRFYWIDASVQYNLFNDRMTLTLQAKDIFNTNQLKFDIDRADYRFYVHQKPEYPVIMFSMSYKFNNYKESDKSVKTKLKI